MTRNAALGLFVASSLSVPLLVLAGLALLMLPGGRWIASPATEPLAGVPVCRANAGGASSGRLSADLAFMAENEVAMARMMAAMRISPTGDVDQDFVAMMVAHHRGAIDMAVAELRHGRNEPLRRIAQEIVVTQGQEIEAMQRAELSADAQPGRGGGVAVSNQGVVLNGAIEEARP